MCGSDGKWYKSECALKQLNCDNGTNIKEVDDAICEKSKFTWWTVIELCLASIILCVSEVF